MNTKQKHLIAGRDSLEDARSLRAILNAIGDAVIAVDTDGAVTRMNPVAEKLTGWMLEEARGKPLIEVFHIVHAKTHETAGNPVEKVLSTGETVVPADHTALIAKDGTEYQIADYAAPIRDDDKKITGAVLVFRDVNEEYQVREAELRHLRSDLSNIIDSMPSVLVGVDGDGKVTQWNKKAEQTTGISAGAAQGKPLSHVFPRMAPEMEKIFESIRTREAKRERAEPRQSAGGVRHEDVTIYPLIADGVEGAVIRIDDITEKVRMEEVMIQGEKMLSVGGLAAGMAHEINNPLAGMIQTANVMARRLVERADIPANREAARAAGTTMEAIREFMEAREIPRMISTINESGRRAAEIVDNMLGFARKSEAMVSSHSLEKLLDKTLELAATDYDLKTQYDFKAIEIEKEYETDLPCVPCEGAKLQQVLLNILRNGAQAMRGAGKRKPRFIVRMRVEKERKFLRIEIEDNGPGMDEATRRRVFEPFFTTKPVGVGTGLGLSVSYFIITENHGGEMAVESRPGSGATFIIHLPLEGGIAYDRINTPKI